MATTLTTLVLILSVFFILNFIPSPSFSCPLHHKQALLQFKSTIINSTQSSLKSIQLNSWNPNSDCCKWEHVKCTNTTITELHLSNLVPDFPNPIRVISSILLPLFNIQSLKLLDISRNSLQGPIPSQLFEIESLQLLDLSYNFLSGNVPEEIGRLTNLRELYLGKNQFSGGIPSSVVKLIELESLDLSDNSFSMQIPSEIGMLPNMTRLDLSKNKFTGLIPSSFHNLSKLETLRLQNNKLVGVIPTWLFNIKTLKHLFIGGIKNKLVWNNRAKIVPMCSLQQISMTSCGISDEIPEWIESQTDLHFLDLSMNQLNGSFPNWLTKMNISGIVLSDNNLTESIPPRLFESTKLEFLALSRNHFSGELPENIGHAGAITALMLSGNRFSGNIPKSMANMHRLHVLDLSRRDFARFATIWLHDSGKYHQNNYFPVLH